MNTNPEVESWLASYDNPQKATVLSVREIILGADRRIEECIKWKSPTFTYQGNLASFNPNSKKHASLMFHTGAQIPGKFPSLQGGGGTARYMQFDGLDQVQSRKAELVAIVKAWCDSRGGTPAATKPAAAKRGAAKKTASKKVTAKTSASRKVAGKKTVSKKTPMKKAAAKKSAPKKVVAKTPAKRAASKKRARAKKK
jgi:hypothetical protein